MKSEFHWHNVTKEKLINQGFQYSRGFSTDECDAYVNNFTVYRWNLVDVLIARIVVYLDGDVKVTILDKSTRGVYATYYNATTQQAPIISTIDKKLTYILKELGVIKNVKSKNKKIA